MCRYVSLHRLCVRLYLHVYTCTRHAQGVCWFGDDPRQTALQKALAHWTCTLPFMMLFHVCEGHDVRAVLKVSCSSALLVRCPHVRQGCLSLSHMLSEMSYMTGSGLMPPAGISCKTKAAKFCSRYLHHPYHHLGQSISSARTVNALRTDSSNDRVWSC